jgi:hypothetical protein
MAKAKAKAKARPPRPSFCNVLKRGIEQLKKDIIADRKAIRLQEALIQQLIKQKAKPEIIKAAQERLAMLQSTLESDEAQLSAFQDEFAADCT